MIHELKLRQEYFHEIRNGVKTFEVRKDDRPFEVGDYLALNGIDGDGRYIGDALLVRVTYILRDQEFCKEGYAILGIVWVKYYAGSRRQTQEANDEGCD